jgi:DnaJ like chaperone protein
MSVWTRLGRLASSGAGAVGSAVWSIHDALKSVTDGQARRQLGFTIAMIALSAKMAKADGVVTHPEVEAFRQIFEIPVGEEGNVSRVYNLARSQVAGFESYARDVADLFGDDPKMLEDVLDGLFHIAKADGVVHERELAYLERVARIFGLDEAAFAPIRARHAADPAADPWLVLGADPSWDAQRLKRRYRQLVVDNHPDRLIARGVPEECVAIATERLAAINAAWEAVARARDVA